MRFLSSTSDKPVYQRKALEVKDTDLSSEYLETIRQSHDPSLHLKTIEDELKSTIGKALGRQGEKVLQAVRDMNAEFERYQQATDVRLIKESVQRYNDHRARALQARWELLVHRQAAGFIVDNHSTVMRHFPIPQALPENGHDGTDARESSTPRTEEPRTNSGQLDWWRRVGRWK